jgi:hypothetical protein
MAVLGNLMFFFKSRLLILDLFYFQTLKLDPFYI